MINFLRYHWHTWLGFVVSLVAGGIGAGSGMKLAEAWLMGSVCGSIAFLIPTGWMLCFASEDYARHNACREDENRAVLLSLILSAVVVSFAAVFTAIRDGAHDHKSAAPFVVGLSLSTIVLSWLVVQSLFAIHYAHRYFGDPDDNGKTDEGFKFTGDAPSSYRDFVYVAVCMGATCQVSDFNCTNTRIRNLITVHAMLAFFFNTIILALGINIVASIIGQ